MTQAEVIKDTLRECLSEAGVFKPTAELGHFFEADMVGEWLCVAAGVDEPKAKRLFLKNDARQRRSQQVIQIDGGGSLSFAFKIRPFDLKNFDAKVGDRVSSFSPGRDVPFIEFEEGLVHLRNIESPGSKRISHLRWELECGNAYQKPQEKWLSKWYSIIGFNPAHPVAHLHVNQTPMDQYDSTRDAQAHSPDELRLATGVPNPLALFMSIAAWLR